MAKIKCSKCKTKGYKHILDLQGQSYDLEDGVPIYTELMNEKEAYCHDCFMKYSKRVKQ